MHFWAAWPFPPWSWTRRIHRWAIAPDGKVLLAATRTGPFRKEGESASWTRVRDEKDPMDVPFQPPSSSQAVAVADPNLVSAWVDQNKGTVSRSREGGKSYQKQNDPVGYLGYPQLDYSLGG
jgi:hypothetical protein